MKSKLKKWKQLKLPIKLLMAFLLFLSTLSLILYLNLPRVPILGFHAIVDPQSKYDLPFINAKLNRMNYEKESIEILLNYLVRRNFWFLSSQELYDYFVNKSKAIPREHLGQKPIMLSFDDGYKNNYTNLMPILENIEKKYNKKVKIVLFVNPGTLAKSQNNASLHLSCKDLRVGLKKGYYDIQSHGFSHKKLTEIKDRQELNNEIYQAQTELRKCVEGLDPNNQVATHIAYPFGATNRKVEKYAAKYYLSGYLYNSQMMKPTILTNRYEISRLTINNKFTIGRLMQMAERAKILKN